MEIDVEWLHLILSSASLPLTVLYLHHLPALLHRPDRTSSSRRRNDNNNNTALPHAPSIFHQLLDRQWGTAMASQWSSPTKVSHTNPLLSAISAIKLMRPTNMPRSVFHPKSNFGFVPSRPISDINEQWLIVILWVFDSQPQSLPASAGGRQRCLRQGQNSREERYWPDLCSEIYPQR